MGVNANFVDDYTGLSNYSGKGEKNSVGSVQTENYKDPNDQLLFG